MTQTAATTIASDLPAEQRRLDRVVRALTQFSVRRAQGLFDFGGVRLNGQVCKEPWLRLRDGDCVEVEFDPQRQYRQAAKPRRYSGFEVVFEDEYLIVVNKQANLLTVPTDRGETNTLLHRVTDYLARGQRRAPKLWIVHRLDRGVSGLLMFGKRPEIGTALREQLAARKPSRRYLAIVAGVMDASGGTFESYLATSKSLTRYSTSEPAQGEHAITHFTVLERFLDTSSVELWLETGRRNQIRVHLAEAGHPVLGDQRYQPQQARHRDWTAQRLALQATELGFEHPATGETLHFQIPLAPELAKFLALQRRQAQ